MGKEKKIGIYLRVSTTDQSTDLQRQEILQFVSARGWNNYEIYDSWALKEKVINDFTKNRKQRALRIPRELMQLLREEKLKATGEFVVVSPTGQMVSYEYYRETLKRYCREADIPVVGTHGLRHSTAAIYIEHGARSEDVAQLLDNPTAVERYIHGRSRRVDEIANAIDLQVNRSRF